MSDANSLLVKRRTLLRKGDEICAKAERENRELGADERASVDGVLSQVRTLTGEILGMPAQIGGYHVPETQRVSAGRETRDGTRLGQEGVEVLREARALGVSTLDLGGSLVNRTGNVGERMT